MTSAEKINYIEKDNRKVVEKKREIFFRFTLDLTTFAKIMR